MLTSLLVYQHPHHSRKRQSESNGSLVKYMHAGTHTASGTETHSQRDRDRQKTGERYLSIPLSIISSSPFKQPQRQYLFAVPMTTCLCNWLLEADITIIRCMWRKHGNAGCVCLNDRPNDSLRVLKCG